MRTRRLDERPDGAGRPGRVRGAALELGVVVALYAAYRLGRLLTRDREAVAHANAELVVRAQQALGLPSEAAMQHAFAGAPTLYSIANHYYVTAHFPVVVAFLVWGFAARPRPEYTWARNLLIVQTSLALLMNVAYPLAPPRMFPEWGFVDTMSWLGPNAYSGASATVANQYAAMPSLHVGWAVLIAVVVARTATGAVRALAVLHAITTVVVVVVTANHWLLDGVVAGVLLAVALVVFPGPGRSRVRLPRRTATTEPVRLGPGTRSP